MGLALALVGIRPVGRVGVSEPCRVGLSATDDRVQVEAWRRAGGLGSAGWWCLSSAVLKQSRSEWRRAGVLPQSGHDRLRRDRRFSTAKSMRDRQDPSAAVEPATVNLGLAVRELGEGELGH